MAKARWWLEVGVYSNSFLTLVHPLESPRIIQMRLDDAVKKAQEDYDRALAALENLLAPIPACSDPWLEQERLRLAKAKRVAEAHEAVTQAHSAAAEKAVLAAAAAQKESEEVQAWCEHYLVREQQRFDQRRVRFQTEVNRTVSECKQKVREIKSAITAQLR